MEERLYYTALFELYGSCLTSRRRECVRLSLMEDFTLQEIGEELGISRQAAHDAIVHAKARLDEYEAKLHIRKRIQRAEDILQMVSDLTDELHDKSSVNKSNILDDKLSQIKYALTCLINTPSGQETEECA